MMPHGFFYIQCNQNSYQKVSINLQVKSSSKAFGIGFHYYSCSLRYYITDSTIDSNDILQLSIEVHFKQKQHKEMNGCTKFLELGQNMWNRDVIIGSQYTTTKSS